MRFALGWMGYYKRKKRKRYHQETKSIVQHVFHKWYQHGLSQLRCYNTQNAMALPPAWDAWEEQVKGIWHQSTKRLLECTYCRVKEEVRQYVARLLGEHDWGVVIIHTEAVNVNHKGQPIGSSTTQRPQIQECPNEGRWNRTA